MSREAFIYVVFPSLLLSSFFVSSAAEALNFSFFAKTFFFYSNKNKTHLH